MSSSRYEDGVRGRHELDQGIPFVQLTHPFHKEGIHGAGYIKGDVSVPRYISEIPALPSQYSVKGLFSRCLTEDSADYRPFRQMDLSLLILVLQDQCSGAPVQTEYLKKVYQGNFRQAAFDPCAHRLRHGFFFRRIERRLHQLLQFMPTERFHQERVALSPDGCQDLVMAPFGVDKKDERNVVRGGVVPDERPEPFAIEKFMVAIQRDVLTSQILHVDFYQVRMTEKVKTTPRLIIVGKSPLVDAGGAVMIQAMTEVEVECLPSDLIDSMEVDVSGLETLDDNISVSDLPVPDGVTVLADPGDVVASLVAPRLTLEEEEELEAEAELELDAEEEFEAEAEAEEEAPAEE